MPDPFPAGVSACLWSLQPDPVEATTEMNTDAVHRQSPPRCVMGELSVLGFRCGASSLVVFLLHLLPHIHTRHLNSTARSALRNAAGRSCVTQGVERCLRRRPPHQLFASFHFFLISK